MELEERELLFSNDSFSVGADGVLDMKKEQPLRNIIYELALEYSKLKKEDKHGNI